MDSIEDEIIKYLNKNKNKKNKVKDVTIYLDNISKKMVNKKDVSKSIYKLREQRKISLIKKGNYINYFFSVENSWYLFSISIMIISFISSLFLNDKFILIKGILVSPLLFFYPGYGIVELAYPKSEWNDLEKVALSIGLSLASLAIIGYILNFTYAGLNVKSVSLSLLIFSIVLLILSNFRKFIEKSDNL
ncbi:MAG: DUF1616 domain-containing protein [Nanopusillaceae archaeon]|jgi:hypothetical protein